GAQGKPRLNEQKSVVTLIGLVQDITERKRAEELLRKAHDELETKVLFRTQELVTLNEQLTQEILKRKETERQINARNVLLKLLNQTVSRKAYVDGLVKLIRAWSACAHVGIRVLNEEGGIPYESHEGFDEDFLGLENSLSVKTDHCVCIRMIKGAPEPEEKPFMSKTGSFFCNDTLKFSLKLSRQTEDKFRGVCIKRGFRTLAVTPIRYGEKIVGVMHLADEMPDKIDNSSKEFIEATSGLIGEGIYKFSLEDKIEREKIRHQEQLTEAAKQLEQARRLSDIGTLAATVAHELRNPLAAINMAASNIKRKAQNPLLDRHLHNIEAKVYESDQIINNLLFYSRIKSPHYENVKINSILEECAGLSKRQSRAKKKITIAKKLQLTRNVSVDVDPLQMKEIVCNILNNSYDALPESGGVIEMFTDTNEKSVTICIKDNGTGIEKEYLEKVFDPFFTTKAKGTGLGLAVCRQIINLHGGTIQMASEPGKGTSVCIALPKKGKAFDG
ncbi:MAG: ATP-binding protein, partial [Candidatus Omnitrophica bacterium]|nr:ATP-binding protein [Candidatus Omnitrophota bacterium]